MIFLVYYGAIISQLHGNDDLKLTISAPSILEKDESLYFIVTIENISDKDIAVIMGSIVGHKYWSTGINILTLIGPNEKSRKLQHNGFRRAGRADHYIVPLMDKSKYTIRLSLDDYISPDTLEYQLILEPGEYKIRATFVANVPTRFNVDLVGLKFMNFWEGTLQSNVAEFRINN